MEAQRIKSENTRAGSTEEDRSRVSLGTGKGEVNLSDFIKGEYLMASPFTEIKVPSKVEIKIPAHKQEATCLCFNSIGDAVVTGGADSLVKIWSANTGKEV
jgi:WD40 repeat protein